MEGWIKLHRKLLNNDLIRDDKALQIFIWLLLKVDRKTGQKKIARSWACQELNIKPTTFYDSLQRLVKKYKMATAKPTANFTIISLINWQKYQQPDSTPDISPTASRQQADTLQEVKNRELREERDTSPQYLLNIPSNDLAEFSLAFICTDRQVINKGQQLYDYCEANGKKYKDYKAFLRNALRKDFGDRPPVMDYPISIPDISEEQRLKNIKKIKEIKEKLIKGFN